MNYYQEITLLPDSEIALGFIWQKIYQQVHIALVENKVTENASAIGVGFPNFSDKGFPLGNKLRLFAHEQSQLEQLNIIKYLQRFSDYVHIKSIQTVPDDARHVCFVRKTIKGTARIEQRLLRKAQYQARESGKSLAECIAELEKTKPIAQSKLPFIWMLSLQTQRINPKHAAKFPIFIEKMELNAPQKGLFTCYGLGLKPQNEELTASVPMF